MGGLKPRLLWMVVCLSRERQGKKKGKKAILSWICRKSHKFTVLGFTGLSGS